MNINISITTQSGSIYELQLKDGELYIRRGTSHSGKVVALSREIHIGGMLHVQYVDNIHGPTYILEGPITNITIC